MKTCLACLSFALSLIMGCGFSLASSTIVLGKKKAEQSFVSIGNVTKAPKKDLKLGGLRLGEASLPSKKLTLSERNRLRTQYAVKRQQEITEATGRSTDRGQKNQKNTVSPDYHDNDVYADPDQLNY